jgi:ribosome biogenesis GTPase
MSLRALGWNSFFEEAFKTLAQEGQVAARVAVQHRGGYEVWTAKDVLAADVSGRFRHHTRAANEYPAVGDWVVIDPLPGEERAVIQAVLPRRTKFSRMAAGIVTEEQLVATNIDEVFVMESLAFSPNLRRIERFLTLAWDHGTTPAVVLTKSDLCGDVPSMVRTVTEIAREAAVLAICSLNGHGLDRIKKHLKKGRTIALLGPSGVGKSTLINCLAGEESQPVQPVREDDQKGRHTTTQREMVFLPGGGVIIDTPGLRELQLWEGSQGLEATFTDIESLATRCRFTDCRHENEPGCAVRDAVQSGTLDGKRLAAFQKLRAEVAQFSERRAIRSRSEERRRSKSGPRGRRG